MFSNFRHFICIPTFKKDRLYIKKKNKPSYIYKKWPDPELNWGHKDFQSSALPTELSGLKKVLV